MRKKMIQCFERFSLSMRKPPPRQPILMAGHFEKDAHTAILLEDSSGYGAYSSQSDVWTKYLHVCIISGAHVLKLSPRSFRQDFFSHKLVIALDCTQKKKRFNFLFLHFLTNRHSTSPVQCPNLVMYICRPNVKFEKKNRMSWMGCFRWTWFYPFFLICTYFWQTSIFMTNISHSDQYRQHRPDCLPYIYSPYDIHSLLCPLKFVTANYNREKLGRQNNFR